MFSYVGHADVHYFLRHVCPCTDWHWQVKRKLGETELPASYIKYYLDYLTGQNWNPTVVDVLVLVLGVGALVLSVELNWRDYRRKRSY